MAYKFVNADQLDADLTTVANAIRTKGKTTAQMAFPSGMVSAISEISTGAELNFEVVGGTSAPSSPNENTIWVNTDESVTEYYFSATQPESAKPGAVWITIGTSSHYAFNALKENGIQVYPLSASQYVSGEWVDKTTKIYQSGAWVYWWQGEMYVEGNQYAEVTGGWTVGTGSIQDSTILVGSTANKSKFTTESTHGTAVDLTDFAELNVHFLKYSCPNTSNGFLNIIIRNEAGTIISTTKLKGGDTTASDFYGTVNISAINVKAFVVIQVGHTSSSANAVYATFDKVVLSR